MDGDFISDATDTDIDIDIDIDNNGVENSEDDYPLDETKSSKSSSGSMGVFSFGLALIAVFRRKWFN